MAIDNRFKSHKSQFCVNHISKVKFDFLSKFASFQSRNGLCSHSNVIEQFISNKLWFTMCVSMRTLGFEQSLKVFHALRHLHWTHQFTYRMYFVPNKNRKFTSILNIHRIPFNMPKRASFPPNYVAASKIHKCIQVWLLYLEPKYI